MRTAIRERSWSSPQRSSSAALLHILLSGFVRIRQYGFLANRERRKKLASCRALLGVSTPSGPPASKQESTEGEPKLCPACGIGHLILVRLPATASPHSLRLRSDSS